MKFLLKHPRLILWYITIVPFSIMFLIGMVIESACFLFSACMAVIENLAFRYELWAKYNAKDSLFNSPYKYKLTEVFVRSLNGSDR